MKKAVTQAKKKAPRPGDAPEGLEIGEVEKQDIRDLIMQFGQEEARRREHGRNSALHLAGEWGEFNRRFQLSSYDRLPRVKFEEAISYLKQKLFAKRNNEPMYLTIERERKGIYGIAGSLGWSEEQRRKFYYELTGKHRLSAMTRREIHKVFEGMSRLQDAAG